MYNAFFGFKEKPFKLVPNPDYLYLSKSHEIALAHLTYATDQGDGFVVITGEVGTGKTTLCRIFLEKLDAKSESAYIFNPQLDSFQLLSSICHEFGIKKTCQTVKESLDVLNGYLIERHQAGRNVLLVIDEAQNLTIENLEMVRMLSNLETTRNKLLQIILVGQPELSDTLDAYEMRQLAQRISLSCHLVPLSGKETEGYIRHRVNIAAQRDVCLFSSRACRRIHRYANGIPRLINIASDRALLTAFSLNRKKVNAAVAQTAIKELSNRGNLQKIKQPVRQNLPLWMLLGLAVLLLVAIAVWRSGLIDIRSAKSGKPSGSVEVANNAGSVDKKVDNETDTPEVPAVAIDSPTPGNTPFGTLSAEESVVQAPPQGIENEKGLNTFIADLDPEKSRFQAAATVLRLWRQPAPVQGQIPGSADDQRFFDILARQYGLRLYSFEADWDLVRRLNMPVIVALAKEQQPRPFYVTLVQIKGEKVLVTDGNDERYCETDFDTLQSSLAGEIHLIWKNVTGFDFIIAGGAHDDAVMAVKSLLAKAGYDIPMLKPDFDQETLRAVVDFQTRNKLKPDGLVGPLTKIMLINAAKAYNVPRLDPGDDASGA